MIFGFDNGSSRHSENHKNNYLILVEGASNDMNDSAEKKLNQTKNLVLTLLIQKQNYVSVYITMVMKAKLKCDVNRTATCEFKAIDNILAHYFCSRSVLKDSYKQ